MALTDIINKLLPAIRQSRLARTVRDGTTSNKWDEGSEASLYSKAALVDDCDADLTSTDDDKIKGKALDLAAGHVDRVVAELRAFARNYGATILTGPGAEDLKTGGYTGEALQSPEAVLKALAERAFAENRYFTASTITIGAASQASGFVGSVLTGITAASEFRVAGAVETSPHPGMRAGTLTCRVTAVDPSTNQPTVTATIQGGILDGDAETPQSVPVIVPNLRRLTATPSNLFDVARGADGLIGNSVCRNQTSDTGTASGAPYGSTSSGVTGKLFQAATPSTINTISNRNDRRRCLRMASAAGTPYHFRFDIPVASGASSPAVAQPGDRLEVGILVYASGVTAGNVTFSLLSGAALGTVISSWTLSATQDWGIPAAGIPYRFTLDRLTSGLSLHASASALFAGSVYIGYMQIIKTNLADSTKTGIPPIGWWMGPTAGVVGDTLTRAVANDGAGVIATEMARTFGHAGRLPTQSDRRAGSSVISDPAVT